MNIKALVTGLLCFCAFAPSCATAGVNAWTPVGPDGGRAYDVEFSQTSPGTFYALGGSGLYRSTVTGDSFELLEDDFGRSAYDFAVDPTRVDRLFVAAEGVQVGDGGSWTRKMASLVEQGAKVATSRDGSTVYFAAETRMFRSQDHGATWQERAPLPGVPPGRLVNALQVDPGDPNVVYANSFGLGLFVSTDGGGAWQRLGGNDPAIIFILNFVVDPSNPLRLLAATNDAGLRISDDRGLVWNAANAPNQLWDVDVDPRNPSIIYVSTGNDIRKSEDNGTTWKVLQVDQPRGSLRLAIDPTDPSRLAVFDGEGVSISTDAGATWAKRIAGFKGTNSTAFSPLPSSRRNYFGVNGRGVYYLDAGESLARSVNNDPLVVLATPPGGPFTVRVLALPGNRDMLYAVLNGEVLAQSVDASLHWTKLQSPMAFINVVAASPLEPRTLYAGGSPGAVYKSLDGGASWAASAAGLPDQLSVYAIAIASTPATLYAIGQLSANSPGATQWGLYRSGDAGATWSAASPLQSRPITSVTVDPNDAQVVYGGFDSELRRTTDGGATWSTFTSGAFRLCCTFGGVVFDPADSKVFYGQHSGGVWRTVDAGVSWQNVVSPFRAAFAASSGALALDPENRNRLLMGFTELGVRELTIAPDLNLTITPPGSVAANAAATYVLRMSNLGTFDATNVRVTVQLPAGATAVSIGGGACTVGATTASCAFDVVRSGVSAAAISLTFVPASVPVTVSASVASDQPDSQSANNFASNTIAAAASAPPASGGGGGATSPLVLTALVVLACLRVRRASV